MFINNFDPVAFNIFSLEIRWYSLSYIFGIILGWVYCKTKLIKSSEYQKIFDVLNKLETKQQNLCEKWCLLEDKLNNYEEKFIVRKPTMGVM